MVADPSSSNSLRLVLAAARRAHHVVISPSLSLVSDHLLRAERRRTSTVQFAASPRNHVVFECDKFTMTFKVLLKQ